MGILIMTYDNDYERGADDSDDGDDNEEHYSDYDDDGDDAAMTHDK